MTTTRAITGKPCDRFHPYPEPAETAWIDALEYDDESRETDDGRPGIDPTPIFRAIAAELWTASCYDQHVGEVAEDAVLTAHVVAVTAAASAPEKADMMTAFAFEYSGAAAVFNALRSGGLIEAREVVDRISVEERKGFLGECLAQLRSGHEMFHNDIQGKFLE